MKNIIKSFAVAAAMLLSTSVLAADTSYLYWMTENLGSFDGAAWTYAQVKYDSGSGTGYLAYGSDATKFQKSGSLIDGDFFAMQVAIGSLTLGNSYKFALELFNGDNKVVGSSAWLAYDAGFVGGKSMSAKEAVFTGFQIPEPTSGLLMLLGFGALALRRKQKKV